MKAGTTSLCRDMESHPSIYFPSVKEPHTLCLPDVETQEGQKRYAALFAGAEDHELCGEGSTGYTKLPLHKGVPARARALLGPHLKLIYIVREPIARAVSHHYHVYRGGDGPRNFRQAVQANPMIIACSCYASQLKPWIDVFTMENIHVVQFESYVRNRTETLRGVFSFLGVDAAVSGAQVQAFNVGEEQLLPPPRLRDLIRSVTRSQWYKRNIHPRTPTWVRDRVKSSLYQKASGRPDPPGPDDVDALINRFRPEIAALQRMLDEPDPYWDLARVRQQYQVPEEAKPQP